MAERIDSEFQREFFIIQSKLDKIEKADANDLNWSALCLVLKTIDKIYDWAIDIGEGILNRVQKLDKPTLKKFYTISAKLYFVDFYIFSSITQSTEDIFWKSFDDPLQRKLMENYEFMKVDEPQKVAKSY